MRLRTRRSEVRILPGAPNKKAPPRGVPFSFGELGGLDENLCSTNREAIGDEVRSTESILPDAERSEAILPGAPKINGPLRGAFSFTTYPPLPTVTTSTGFFGHNLRLLTNACPSNPT